MKESTKILGALSLATILTISGCNSSDDTKEIAGAKSTDKQAEVLTSYANIATDVYVDTLTDAKALQSALRTFTATPNDTTLQAAKDAWLVSRESYLQTEALRLSNGPIDAEEGWVADAYGALEGQLNAWPLNEHMIDYTTDADGNITSGNIIDTASAFKPIPDGDNAESESVESTIITPAVLTALNENGGDANVATGYHAIEFLLWGQDQDYNSFIDDTITNGADRAGERPVEDYTSNANADRRKDYLTAAADKMVMDLQVLADAWSKTASSNCSTDATGCYRAAFLGTLSGADASKNLSSDEALENIFFGMGQFIKTELANERIAVAVLNASEEDEHSCFSDNTHRDILQDFAGFTNVLKASYNGKSYGTSMYSLASSENQKAMDALILRIEAKINKVDAAAKNGIHFDYQIKAGSDTRQDIIDMKSTMRKLGDEMPKVANDFGITIGEVRDPNETVI